jgi:isopentenyldiphosphate isomerase
MSIATDEAEKRYGNQAEPGSTFWYRIEEDQMSKRIAYVAGRHAEPTETEIDAAARAMAARNADSTAPEDVDVEFSQWRRDKYLLDAKAALLAARKAVAE